MSITAPFGVQIDFVILVGAERQAGEQVTAPRGS
jgi:hypothetical protein